MNFNLTSSKYQNQSTGQVHVKAAKRFVSYLKQTIEAKLIYRINGKCKIFICADSNFDGDEESFSTLGVTV